MVVSLSQRRSTRRSGRRFAFRLALEVLEARSLPSVATWPGFLHPVAETEPNDTLNQAQNLGDLNTTPRAEVIGAISNGPTGAGVDWYSFSLDHAANVSISTPPATPSSQPVTTLSLYNSDPNDANDPYDVLGHRLLEQADSAAQGGATIQRRLAPGTYYVAVSGLGNHYFSPFVAGSGYAGATGDYGLLLTAADLGLLPSDGPAVLAADPQPGATLDRSPFLIHVAVSEPLDLNTVSAGGTVALFSNPNGTFGDGNDQVVNLASATLNTAGNELLIAPAAPLAPGYYEIVLAGDTSVNTQVLAANGVALGTSSSRPTGADFTSTFQIGGNEGNSAGTADDTPATSHQLGDVTKAGLVQIAGAIGDDSTDPTISFNGSDVDLYHFRLSGAGNYAFIAEVFAGRIGSPLSAGTSLFQVNAITGQLDLIGSNAGTLNKTLATDGRPLLLTDSVLYAGLGAGDYYLAVTNSFNVPDPVNSPPGTNGVFDPNVSHSGQNGGSTGDYVLNLHVQSDSIPPRVVAVTPKQGATLNGPPTRLTIQFSETVNIQQLAFQAYQQNALGTVASVYVLGSDGSKYSPLFESYDDQTNQATFLMLDGLGNGAYELHLSGRLGLTDLAGNPLVGNDSSGDYVVHFKVNGPAPGAGSNPLFWSDQEPNNNLAQAQNLGVLFRHELQTGVTLQRNLTQNSVNSSTDTADYYGFQVLEGGDYLFNFSTANLPAGAQATLLDASGTSLTVARQPGSPGFSANLQPGIYVLRIGDWTTSQSAFVSYNVVIKLVSIPDNPVPLTVGPAPAISIQPVSTAPPSSPPAPVVVNPPTTPPPASVSTSLPAAPTTDSANTTATASSAAPNTGPSATTPPGQTELPTASLVGTSPASGGSTSGATPALLRGTPDRPAPSVTLPSSVLLALGAAPVGSINNFSTSDPPPPADRILVRLPNLSSLQPGVAFIPATDSGTSATNLPAASALPTVEPTESETATLLLWAQSKSPTPLGQAAGQQSTLLSLGIGQLVNSSYRSALDVLFGMARRLGETGTQHPYSRSLPEDFAGLEESVDYEGNGAPLVPGATRRLGVTHQILVNGLAVLGAIAVVRSEEKKRAEIRD